MPDPRDAQALALLAQAIADEIWADEVEDGSLAPRTGTARGTAKPPADAAAATENPGSEQ